MGTMSFIFERDFFLACVNIQTNFTVLQFVRWGMPLAAIFCHQCGQQLNLSQVSIKAASSVDKEKLLKKYFHRGYPYAALIMRTSDCGSGCFKSCDAFYR